MIAEQLARALVVLGDAGLVHRDLKPRNIICGAGDSVYILDLGLAYDPQKPPITTTQWGTRDYMAPEQQLNRRITPATDIWALGLILAELTGRRHPYGGLLADVRLAAMADPSIEPDLSQVPPGWRGLVRECLRHDPAERPTAEQLLERIRRLRKFDTRLSGCLDLFSGTGSLAAGVQSAGIRVALTADFDPTSRGLCDHLLGTPTFLETDLHHAQAGELLEASGLKPGEVVLVCGEPPFRAFSPAGNRQAIRETGLEAWVRLVSDLKPHLVAFVGPVGLSRTRLSSSLGGAQSSLRAAGYRLAVPQILDSSEFGATVACRRLLMVGRIDGPEPREVRVPDPGATAALRVRDRLAAVERAIAIEPYGPRLPEKVRESLAKGVGRDRWRVRLKWDDRKVRLAGARWVIHPDGNRCLNLSELASLYGYHVGSLPGGRRPYDKLLTGMLPRELTSAIGGHLRDELAR